MNRIYSVGVVVGLLMAVSIGFAGCGSGEDTDVARPARTQPRSNPGNTATTPPAAIPAPSPGPAVNPSAGAETSAPTILNHPPEHDSDSDEPSIPGIDRPIDPGHDHRPTRPGSSGSTGSTPRSDLPPPDDGNLPPPVEAFSRIHFVVDDSEQVISSHNPYVCERGKFGPEGAEAFRLTLSNDATGAAAQLYLFPYSESRKTHFIRGNGRRDGDWQTLHLMLPGQVFFHNENAFPLASGKKKGPTDRDTECRIETVWKDHTTVSGKFSCRNLNRRDEAHGLDERNEFSSSGDFECSGVLRK